MKLLLAAALALLSSTPAWAVEKPAEVVAKIYAEEGAVITPAKLTGYYSRDLAAALKTDQDEEIGAIGFDWLYGAQDFDISGLVFEETAVSPDRSSVEARFLNFGEPASIYWLFCQRPDGAWRVDNVLTPDWNLRELLGLGAETAC